MEQYLIQTEHVQNTKAGQFQAHQAAVRYDAALNGYTYNSETLKANRDGSFTYTRYFTDKNGTKVVFTVTSRDNDITGVSQR